MTERQTKTEGGRGQRGMLRQKTINNRTVFKFKDKHSVYP